MLKEVGSSGQISLGKRFAKQLFDVVFHGDGRVELLPVRVVSAARSEPTVAPTPADGWLPPGGYDRCTPWALDNRQALEAYAMRVAQDGTAAEQLQGFLDGSGAAAAR